MPSFSSISTKRSLSSFLRLLLLPLSTFFSAKAKTLVLILSLLFFSGRFRHFLYFFCLFDEKRRCNSFLFLFFVVLGVVFWRIQEKNGRYDDDDDIDPKRCGGGGSSCCCSFFFYFFVFNSCELPSHLCSRCVRDCPIYQVLYLLVTLFLSHTHFLSFFQFFWFHKTP